MDRQEAADERIQQILENPHQYFARARARAERIVREEIRRERFASSNPRSNSSLRHTLGRLLRRTRRERRPHRKPATHLATTRRDDLAARLEHRWSPSTPDDKRQLYIENGWLAIVSELVASLDEDLPMGWSLLAVNTKSGELRVRARPTLHDDRHKLSRLVTDASALADRTCQHCGLPGRRVLKGREVLIRCDAHTP